MPKLSEATKPRDKSKMVRVDPPAMRPFLLPPPPPPGEQGNVGFIAPTPSQFATDADLRAQRISKGGTWIPLFPAPPQAHIATGATAASQAKVATKQVPQVKTGISSTGAATIAVTPAASPSNPAPLPGPAIPIAKNLQQLPDGTSRFARTSVHSSHAPTTNPLTGHDAGANVTINVAAHTMQVGATAVSNNSGSVTALNYSTLYYIYYDDPTLAGGAVSYQATTTKTTAINGAGRFFVGSIFTPAATAPDTNGNGDGGTGSQVGTLYRFFPNTATPTLSGNGTVSNPDNAIDGDFTTFSLIAANASVTSDSAILLLTGIPGIVTGRAQTITLKVLSSVTVPLGGTGTLTGVISYSTNGGSTFTQIYSTTTSRSLTMDSIVLPLTINPGIIQVQAQFHCTVAGSKTVGSISLFEAWIEIQE